MLCTNSVSLLNSTKGKYSLNYKAPKESPGYSPGSKNLIITWDIFVQGYRTINMDRCELISIIPANDQFWTYFAQKLSNMGPDEKARFMVI